VSNRLFDQKSDSLNVKVIERLRGI